MRGKCQTEIVFASPSIEIPSGISCKNSSPTYTSANSNPVITAIIPVEFFTFLIFINNCSFLERRIMPFSSTRWLPISSPRPNGWRYTPSGHGWREKGSEMDCREAAIPSVQCIIPAYFRDAVLGRCCPSKYHKGLTASSKVIIVNFEIMRLEFHSSLSALEAS
jgi:hypothetical protein